MPCDNLATTAGGHNHTHLPLPLPTCPTLARRVFGDKLVSHEDKGWLDKQLGELCKHEFPPDLCKQASGRRAWPHRRPFSALLALLFGDSTKCMLWMHFALACVRHHVS